MLHYLIHLNWSLRRTKRHNLSEIITFNYLFVNTIYSDILLYMIVQASVGNI